MLSDLWNYLHGYVIIKVTGFSTERFINLALHKNILFWQISQTTKGVILKVRLRDFKQLKSCARKSKCKIKIQSRYGMPFFIHKNKKRTLYLLGIFSFVILLYTLSSFIWQIDIEGNTRLNDAELLSFCEQQGFKVGTYKPKLDTKLVIQELKNNFPDISWVTIRINGTSATIKLAETIPKAEIPDTTKPCNIIAKTDGIITDIITSKGTPLVKKNDTVKKGDLLVTSELAIKDGDTVISKKYVYSSADIKAKQWYNINISVPLKYNEKQYTNTRTDYALRILNKEFNLNFLKKEIYFKNYDTIENEIQLKVGKNFALPLFLKKIYYKEYQLIPQTLTEDKAKAIAEKKLTAEIINKFSSSAEIIDKKLEFSKTDTELMLNAKIILIDEIGEVQFLTS